MVGIHKYSTSDHPILLHMGLLHEWLVIIFSLKIFSEILTGQITYCKMTVNDYE